MKKLITSILFSLLLLHGSSQQYNSWYFGKGAGLSFDPGGGTIPSVLTDGINNFAEGNAGICDVNGKILFYTDGNTIYNRAHQVMLNGDNLLGHPSAIQSSVIIPGPGNDSMYYVFTTDADENYYRNGYRYSVVNMKHDGGKGEVVTKNVLLNASCTERLTAARHGNGFDVWIIGNEKGFDVFKAWLLTCTGVSTTPVVSAVGKASVSASYGMMKVSPDGKQLCETNYPHFEPDSEYLQLFDFDNATGKLSNARVIKNLTGADLPYFAYYGCEFSSDSRFLYASSPTYSFVDQFEAKLGSAADINNSRVTIPATGDISGIQRGPDGKIYLNHQDKFLSVISQPTVKGIGCTFEFRKISLENKNGSYGLPAVINDGFTHPYNNNSGPNIQVPPGQTIEWGQSVQLKVSGGGTSFLWSPPQWLNDAAIQNPVASPREDIIYTVTVTNDLGCKGVDSIAIHVKTIDDIYVPTGFTPFNDGRNDVFRPVIGLQNKLEEFSVYNRWGQKVFSTSEYGKGWDGKLNGQKQNNGIYVWFIRVKTPLNKKLEKKGTVMLIY